MRKGLFFIMLTTVSTLVNAQVGINTVTPIVTLQIEPTKTDGTTAEGLLLPRLTLQQLVTKDDLYQQVHDGALLYITDPTGSASTKTQNVTKRDFYSFDGNAMKWVGISQNNNVDFLYMPSIVLPLSSTETAFNGIIWSGNTCKVDLYNIYSNQFKLINASETVKNPSSEVLNTLEKNKLDYFITYYDNTVYTSVNVTDDGVLTYQKVPGSSKTDKTFMNIILKIKK